MNRLCLLAAFVVSTLFVGCGDSTPVTTTTDPTPTVAPTPKTRDAKSSAENKPANAKLQD